MDRWRNQRPVHPRHSGAQLRARSCERAVADRPAAVRLSLQAHHLRHCVRRKRPRWRSVHIAVTPGRQEALDIAMRIAGRQEALDIAMRIAGRQEPEPPLRIAALDASHRVRDQLRGHVSERAPCAAVWVQLVPSAATGERSKLPQMTRSSCASRKPGSLSLVARCVTVSGGPPVSSRIALRPVVALGGARDDRTCGDGHRRKLTPAARSAASPFTGAELRVSPRSSHGAPSLSWSGSSSPGAS